MGDAKWESNVAIVRAASASAAPITGYKYPLAKKVTVNETPIIYEQKAQPHPDITRQYPAGFQYDWSIEGIEASANIFGYLMALWFGTHIYSAGIIVITGGTTKEFLNILIDRGLDLGTSQPTERLVGCQIESWDLVCNYNEVATLSIRGKACDRGALDAALVVTVPSGALEAPLSWAALQAGDFEVGYNGGTLAQDDDITKFTISGSWASVERGRNLGSDQPTDLRPGRERVITYGFDKEFSGAGAIADYTAFIAQQDVEMCAKFLMDTNYVQIDVQYAQITKTYPGDIGDEDGPIMAGIEARARWGGAIAASVTVEDASTAVYWA